ncbi:hypothetical protein ACOME3_000614 [Neoechinorhynchus agilis]
MSNCNVRAIRHTAVFIATKILDGLCKSHSNELKTEQFKELFTVIINGVVLPGLRDVCWNIRYICLQQLSELFSFSLPGFNCDEHYKYIGWAFYDQMSDCRLLALEVLLEIAKKADNVSNFIDRFKGRIINMTLDRDTSVCAAAINVIGQLLISGNQFQLHEDQKEGICSLVYHSNAKIARAAARFLILCIDMELEVGGKRKKKRSRANGELALRERFMKLVTFADEHNLVPQNLSARNATLVDALWADYKSMLSDFKLLFNILYEPNNLGDKAECTLIDLIVCCAERAVNGNSVVLKTYKSIILVFY